MVIPKFLTASDSVTVVPLNVSETGGGHGASEECQGQSPEFFFGGGGEFTFFLQNQRNRFASARSIRAIRFDMSRFLPLTNTL